MSLNGKQKTEIASLQKIIRQYQGVARTSKSSEILYRTKIDLKKAKDRLQFLCPAGIPTELIQSYEENLQKATLENTIKNYSMLSHFPILKISPHCENDDINFLSTIIQTWDNCLSPAISDQYIILDFSISPERDVFHRQVENIKWQMKTLIDTIEDYHSATQQNSKIQLLEIKTRQSRNFLHIGSIFIKELINFWSKVYKDILKKGHLCINLNEKVTFEKKLNIFISLNNQKIIDILKMLITYLEEALEVLNPPNIEKYDSN